MHVSILSFPALRTDSVVYAEVLQSGCSYDISHVVAEGGGYCTWLKLLELAMVPRRLNWSWMDSVGAWLTYPGFWRIICLSEMQWGGKGRRQESRRAAEKDNLVFATFPSKHYEYISCF